MEFKDEIVPYGGLNPDLGLLLTTNVDRSVHAGLELSAEGRVTDYLKLSGNFAYSYNKVKDFAVSEETYDNDDSWTSLGYDTVRYDGSVIPGFPNYIGNILGDYNGSLFAIAWRGRFVGRQYVELSNIEALSIDPYFVSSVSLSISLGDLLNIGDVVLSTRVDNVFDQRYEYTGYGGASRFRDIADQHWAEYIPAAGRSFFTSLKFELR
jgi:iron complex outermembrane receptor protein